MPGPSTSIELSVRIQSVPTVGMSMMENPNLMDAANFGGPQSPIEMKPDTALLGQDGSPSSPTTSFMGGFGSPLGGSQRSPPPGAGGNYPPSHPLSGAKHMCSICGDRASGKTLRGLLVRGLQGLLQADGP